jgi:DNA-binding NtrC family response regulator
MADRPPQPIVLVDDEVNALICYDTILRMAGYNNIRTLSDSRDVPALLEERGASVVVLDLGMPYMCGGDLIPVVAKTCPEASIIVVSGSDTSLDEPSPALSLASACFVKPVDNDEFLAAVRRAIDETPAREDLSDTCVPGNAN